MTPDAGASRHSRYPSVHAAGTLFLETLLPNEAYSMPFYSLSSLKIPLGWA